MFHLLAFVTRVLVTLSPHYESLDMFLGVGVLPPAADLEVATDSTPEAHVPEGSPAAGEVEVGAPMPTTDVVVNKEEAGGSSASVAKDTVPPMMSSEMEHVAPPRFWHLRWKLMPTPRSPTPMGRTWGGGRKGRRPQTLSWCRHRPRYL